MAIAVVATLAPLAFFKYYGFFAVNVTNGLSRAGDPRRPAVDPGVLPVGISFFSFMAVAYIVDIQRGDTKPASWIDLFLYLSFFPHLVAGPIVRPNELIPQLDVRRDPRHVDVGGAAWLIFGGLFKKVVVSSFLASAIVDPVFGDPARHGAHRDAVRDLGIRGRDLLPTSAATPTSRSASRSSSGSSSRRTSTGPTALDRCRTSGAAGT